VTVVDTASDTVVGSIGVGRLPYGVAITPAGRRAYVTNFGSNTVSVVDTASGTVVGPPIAVGSRPVGVAVTPVQCPAPAGDAASTAVQRRQQRLGLHQW
jgi:YVTN family beta-propeller protein